MASWVVGGRVVLVTLVVVARQSLIDISLAQAKFVGWAGDHPRISHLAALLFGWHMAYRQG